MNPRCFWPVTWLRWNRNQVTGRHLPWVHYTTSCKHSLVLLKMSEIIVRNMLSWLDLLINRYCCIYLVVYIICVNDAWSNKYQTLTHLLLSIKILIYIVYKFVIRGTFGILRYIYYFDTLFLSVLLVFKLHIELQDLFTHFNYITLMIKCIRCANTWAYWLACHAVYYGGHRS
jgi:hypothetical protein